MTGLERPTRVERLQFNSPAAYQVRILSGQFNVDEPFSLEKARVAIGNKRAIEAHDVMHLKWGESRKEAWEHKPGNLGERVDRWANGRVRSLLPVLQTSPSDDLTEGFSLLGFSVAESLVAPSAQDLQTRLKEYFVTDFYAKYAGDRRQSVEALGDVFVRAAKGVTNRFSNADAISAMKKLDALKVVLEPILESETYERLVQATEARIHAGLNDLKPENGNDPLEDVWKQQLEYFKDVVTAAPAAGSTVPVTPTRPAAVEPRPAPATTAPATPRPTTTGSTPVATPAVAEPAPDTGTRVTSAVEPPRTVLVIESDPKNVVEKIKEGIRSTTDDDIIINLPADAMVNNGYLFSTPDGRVKVLEPGVIEPAGSDDAILIRGLRILFKRVKADRNIKLDLSLKNGTDFPVAEIVDTADGPYEEWDRKDAEEEVIAGMWKSFQEKVNLEVADLDQDWVVDGFRITDGGTRFMLGFKKEPPSIPPFADHATIFPMPNEDDPVGSI